MQEQGFPEKLRELTLEGISASLKEEKDTSGKLHRHAILDMLIRCTDQKPFCCYLRLDCTNDNIEINTEANHSASRSESAIFQS